MRKVFSGLLLSLILAGCGPSPTIVKAPETTPDPKAKVAGDPDKTTKPTDPDKTQQVAARPDNGEPGSTANGMWIGASGASDFVMPALAAAGLIVLLMRMAGQYGSVPLC